MGGSNLKFDGGDGVWLNEYLVGFDFSLVADTQTTFHFCFRCVCVCVCLCEFTFAMVDIAVLMGFVAINGATGNGFGGDNGSTFADDVDGGGGGITSVADATCCETVVGGCKFPFEHIRNFEQHFIFKCIFGQPNSFSTWRIGKWIFD